MLKEPPTFIEGEKAILGACLLDNSCLAAVLEVVAPGDFYRTAHATLFSAIQRLTLRNEPVDWVSITAALKSDGKLESVGGPEFLTSLADAVPSAANVLHYATIVSEKARLRRAISTMAELTTKCYTPDTTPDEVEEQFQTAAFSLFTKTQKSSGFVPIKDVIISSFAEMGKQSSVGIPSGLTDLDRLTRGFMPGNLVIIGGRPGMGKTAAALGILETASQYGLCGMFSMEMTPRQITGRLVARKSGMNGQRLRQGNLESWEWTKALEAGDKISSWLVWFDFSSQVTISQMRSRIKQVSIQAKAEMKLLIVDYLTLMKAEGLPGTASEHTKVGSLTKGLKQIAKDFNLAVVCLAQLNRKVDDRVFINKNGIHERKPRLSDFRESGSIEEDADIACGLYRAAAYQEGKDDPQHQGTGQIVVLKNRDGDVGEVTVSWVKETASYWDLARHTDQDDPTASRYDRDESMSVI